MVGNHIAARSELLARAAELFGMDRAWRRSRAGRAHLPLADARRAHEDLGSRKTPGKLVLEIA
jgi:NADPH2:quinone reductase